MTLDTYLRDAATFDEMRFASFKDIQSAQGQNNQYLIAEDGTVVFKQGNFNISKTYDLQGKYYLVDQATVDSSCRRIESWTPSTQTNLTGLSSEFLKNPGSYHRQAILILDNKSVFTNARYIMENGKIIEKQI